MIHAASPSQYDRARVRAWRGSRWTQAADAVLRERYQRDGPQACARTLGRTLKAIQNRARKLGIAAPSRSPAWSPAEDSVLRRDYAARGPDGCAPDLPGRTRSAIVNRAHVLGLRCNDDRREAIVRRQQRALRAPPPPPVPSGFPAGWGFL